jgi:hypothetical protein
MSEDKEKTSIFSKISYIFNLLFPLFKILGPISFLKQSKRIMKESEKGRDLSGAYISWLSKQIILQYILAVVFTAPIVVSIYKSNQILNNNTYLNKVMGEDKSVMDYVNIIKVKKEDSKKIKAYKRHTKAGFLAIILMISSALIFTIAGSVLMDYASPFYYDTRLLLEEFKSQGYIKKGREKRTKALVTNVGCYIRVEGYTPDEMKKNASIWNLVNFIPGEVFYDEKDRNIFFIERKFEVPNKILYKTSELKKIS